LVITNRARLASKLDGGFVDSLLEKITSAGGECVTEVPYPFSGAALARTLKPHFNANTFRGVVLLGDYDVVAPARFDCLPREIREALAGSEDDPDNFLVWSDLPYASIDEDETPELPVSRIPDAHSEELIARCLAALPPASRKLMFRNINRPFADGVFAAAPGTTTRGVTSAATRPDDLTTNDLGQSHLYFMLHGSDFDAERFWGEEDGSYPEAVNRASFESNIGGVVFAGCCWGALIGREPASRVVSGDPPPSRAIQSSIALTCLMRGASAFVGCTGAHYSPLEKPFNYYGKPLHNLFWAAIAEGRRPAEALFVARQAYLKNIPHRTSNGNASVADVAVEFKLYHQFTCLGFGW